MLDTVTNKYQIYRKRLTTVLSKDVPVDKYDVIIVGSGIAGLQAAIKSSNYGRILIITKSELQESNTLYAQGGIAAVLSKKESELQSHIDDTMSAGCGLCEPEIVKEVITEGPVLIQELIEEGLKFDRKGSELHLTKEGGHSSRRILHCGGDKTGFELQSTMIRLCKANKNITILENTFLIDLIIKDGNCIGVLTCDRQSRKQVFMSKTTILATGGVGQVFRETTNPRIATGDGIVAAFRAGAEIANMEFMQFHPTTIYIAGAERTLITEAVRGEGGYLLDAKGYRFMPDYHKDAELAPRDVVSRSILQQIRKVGEQPVYLDLRHLEHIDLKERFPNLANLCNNFGLNISKDLIPVSPSAHYILGGVKVNSQAETSIPGLFACGEVTSSGFHGANRLGSNSLLEGIVFGKIAGETAGQSIDKVDSLPNISDVFSDKGPKCFSDSNINIYDAVVSLRSLMWRRAGVERSKEGLIKAKDKLDFWSYYLERVEFKNMNGWVLQNMLQTAKLIVGAALYRDESRGVHYRLDCPEINNDTWRKEVVFKAVTAEE